ncbi:MAG TPA: hypothetical protein VIG33_09780 [Pseudobdellovibrionaceae bacterium]|jgi:hypothetical protein
MKNMMVLTMLLLGTTSAFAHIENARVCSIGRDGDVYTSDFRVVGSSVIWNQDGSDLNYNVESVKNSSLSKASAACGENVVQATKYVLSSLIGITDLELAIGVSGTQYMIFPDVGVGASSDNCD